MQKSLSLCHYNSDRLEQAQYYLIGLKADLDKSRAVSKEEAQVRHISFMNELNSVNTTTSH